MIARAVFLAFLLTLTCCSHHVQSACGFSDFQPSPYDHIIEDLPAVQTSEFAGRLRVRPRDVEGGIWPRGLDARFEIHGPDGFSEMIAVGEDGTFRRPGLRPGTYCFKLSASGFRSMLGSVVISHDARTRAPLDIELLIAE